MRGVDEAEAIMVSSSRSGHARTRAIVGLLAGRVDGDPLALPLGTRDTALIELRIATFGMSLTTVANCAGCDTEIEADFELDALRSIGSDVVVSEFDVTTTAGERRFRVPTTYDVIAAAAAPDPGRVIAERCAIGIDPGERPLADADVRTISDALAAASPIIDVTIEMTCVDCGRASDRTLDIVAVLSDELDAHCQRVIHDVIVLARAFGWSETDVLSIPPRRRHRYLDVVGS